MPPVVLPITSRGLPLTEGVCRGILAAAMVAAAALILWLNRGATLFVDELSWFVEFGYDLPPSEIIEPYAGHLLAIPRAIQVASLELFGATALPFRLLGVLSVLVTAALFFELMQRKVGPAVALAPTLVLLVLGSAWQHVVVPQGFAVLTSVAAGLAALLALERGDRRGDILACALVCVAVATYTVGLAFLAAVAVSVLAGPARRRRAWIFLIPLALYAVWWVWSLHFDEGITKLSNVLLIPAWSADSLALALAALAGLDYEFSPSPGTDVFNALDTGTGEVLAVAVVAALAWRVKRGSVPASLWASLTIVLVYWALLALTAGVGGRIPVDVRYVYLGVVGVLLVAADAVRPVRPSKLGLAVLYGVATVSIATNLALLRDGAAFLREYSRETRAQLAMLELARGHVPADFRIGFAVPEVAAHQLTEPAGDYLAAVDRFGSPAFSPAEVQGQSESVRQGADLVLIRALGLRLEPVGAPGGECVTRQAAQGRVSFAVPEGGAILRARGSAPAEVTLRRFSGSAAQPVGSLVPGRFEALRIPSDGSTVPWAASVTGPDSVEICSPPA